MSKGDDEELILTEVPPKSGKTRNLELSRGPFPSVLLEPYFGYNKSFLVKTGSGSFEVRRVKDHYVFWHNGFEYPGGVDNHFVSRYGRCERSP